MKTNMFCNQCQEAAKGIGCTIKGVCGKDPELSTLMDALLYSAKGLAGILYHLDTYNVNTSNYDTFLLESLFKTVTNVNFDPHSIKVSIYQSFNLKKAALNLLKEKDPSFSFDKLPDAALWMVSSDEEIMKAGETYGQIKDSDDDRRSLREILLYGIKGMAAYAYHALHLGKKDDEVFKFIHRGLMALEEPEISTDELLGLVMECGEKGVRTMALLDEAHTSRYGHPEITNVSTGVRNRPGILVSGHDLLDLEELLEQSKDAGIDIYTHGEMLPAHYYPFFKKYPHFAGNYGNAWWQQREEFEKFNGPILFTTNCIVPPMENASYKNRIYTTGATGLPGAIHIPDRMDGNAKDFSSIIQHAQKCQPPQPLENGQIVGGFAHHQVISLADKIINAIQTGKIKKFVVMAGCDGRHKERQYYTEFAQKLPHNTVILTAGCAKYRYLKLPLGDIEGIPRVLDAGQCNDSYSLVAVALKLKEVLGLDDINQLPIVYNIAWYEQKAVIVLLALLYLGVKNIHLGPTLPAFLSPNVLKILQEKFQIGSIRSVEEDLRKFELV